MESSSSNGSSLNDHSVRNERRRKRKRKTNKESDEDTIKPANNIETEPNTVTLGYVEKGDKNVIKCVKFIGDDAPFLVYPRGKDNGSFTPDPLEHQQDQYLDSIEKIFRIAFSGLKYADGTWQDSENKERKLRDIKELCNEQLQHYGWKIVNNFIECRNAFLEGMHDSAGRAAIYGMLELVCGLFAKTHEYFIMNVGGGSSRFKGSFNIASVQLDNKFTISLEVSPETSILLKNQLEAALTENAVFKYRRPIPDGQVYLETESEISIVVTVRVKPDIESTDESTYQQTWIQSLGALMKRETTHGVTLTCLGGQLIKLVKDCNRGAILTTYQVYDFKKPDQTFFFDEFWSFFCGLVCILQKG